EKLKLKKTQAEAYLSRYEQLLMQLTRHELNGHAEFESDAAFRLRENPFPEEQEIPLGLYELPRRSDDAHIYRIAHPLAQRLLERAKGRELAPAELTLDCTNAQPAVAALRPYIGRSGEAVLTLLTVESPAQTEDHLLVGAVADGDPEPMDEEAAKRLFTLCV